MPDYLPLVLRTRVTVSEWPKGTAATFPPQFDKEKVAGVQKEKKADRATEARLISIGRQGSIVFRSRPADDAILAIIHSSQKIIRLVLQVSTCLGRMHCIDASIKY